MELRRKNRQKMRQTASKGYKPLSRRQKRWADEYLMDFNQTRASRETGFWPDLKAESNKNLRRYISDVMDSNSEAIEVRHSDLLRRLKLWYESDLTQVIGLKPEEIKELPDDFRQLITKVKHRRKYVKGEIHEVIEVEFVSKEKAIEMVARHIGFFEKDNEQKQIDLDLSKLTDSALRELSQHIGK